MVIQGVAAWQRWSLLQFQTTLIILITEFILEKVIMDHKGDQRIKAEEERYQCKEEAIVRISGRKVFNR